jgi:glycosyltransferase 2 family protein
MAILALPVRLGEFVRPWYVVRDGKIRMSAALGTVAVERIVDGLLISALFFVGYLLAPTGSYSSELRIGAWISLLGFLGLTAFLGLALRWTDATVEITLRATLLRRLAPALAAKVGDKLRSLISGFRALSDPANLVPFLFQSVLYWGMNGFGMWVLAQRMGIPVSLGAAYAAMSFTGVVISLPNPPGNLGLFHLGVKLALLAYLPPGHTSAIIAYAIVLHGIQTFWYVGVGLLSLPFCGGKGGLGAAVRESKAAAAQAQAEPA